jgi:hypothetical protein
MLSDRLEQDFKILFGQARYTDWKFTADSLRTPLV